MHIEVAARLLLQPGDGLGQGAFEELGQFPIDRLEAGRGDISRQRVEAVGEVAGLRRPMTGKDLVGDASESMAPLSASSSSLNLFIASFQTTLGSRPCWAMPSTVMNSVTINLRIASSAFDQNAALIRISICMAMEICRRTLWLS